MEIIAKTSVIRAALANALAALASSKPGATVAVSSSAKQANIMGARAASYPLCDVQGNESTALAHLLGITQGDQSQLWADLKAVHADLDTAISERDAARKDADSVAQAARDITKAAADKVRHLEGQLAEMAGEVRALTKTCNTLRTATQVAQPAAARPTARLLDQVVDAMSQYQAQTAVDEKPEAPAVPGRVTVSFAPGTQTSALRAAGLSTDDLRAAGFRWVFVDRKDPAKGGRWEALASDVAADIARKLSA